MTHAVALLCEGVTCLTIPLLPEAARVRCAQAKGNIWGCEYDLSEVLPFVCCCTIYLATDADIRAHLPRGGVWETRVGVIATLACLNRRTIGLARIETPLRRGFFLNCVTHEWSVPRPRIGPHSKNCEEGRCTLEVSGPVVRTGSEYCA